VLRRNPLFAALDDEQAAELRASMSEVTLARGDSLFHEGDPGDRLYVVTEGKVKLHRTSPDGRENMLAVVGPGELIGELSLFDPGPRTATATALTEVKLLGLGHNDLTPWLSARPEVATALLRAVARRLRKTNDAMSDLVFSDVPGRVARALLDLSRRFGVQSEEGIHVVHDLTQEELAQLVGASRETVNKALADFAQRGWLRLEARAVILLDVERLAKRSRGRPAPPRGGAHRARAEAGRAGSVGPCQAARSDRAPGGTPAAPARTVPRRATGSGRHRRTRGRRPRRACGGRSRRPSPPAPAGWRGGAGRTPRLPVRRPAPDRARAGPCGRRRRRSVSAAGAASPGSRRDGRPDGPPRSCRGPGRCRRSARPGRPAGGSTGSPRCAQAWAPRAVPGRPP